jgi:hypothetical protein
VDVDPNRIADGLLAATLPQAEWTHAAHVNAAHALVRRLGRSAALIAMRDAIPRLNEFHGVENSDDGGYHETLTVFFVGAVAACVERGLDAAATLAELDRGAPLRFWSRDLLFSVPARRAWEPPDLEPLPFGVG